MAEGVTQVEFSPSELAEFLRSRRGAILDRWRAAVEDRPASEGLSLETLIDHIPDLLDAIADTGEEHLHDNRSRLDTETAERHALERLAEGLDLSQVVIELAILRDCILQVWDQERAPGAARPEVRFLNRSMDRAIAASIDRYTQARDRTLKALDRISAAALEVRRLDDLLQRLLDVMVETTAAVDTGAILLREGDELKARAAVGIPVDVWAATPTRIGQGFTGRVAAEARARLMCGAELQGQDADPFLRRPGIQCAYGVPLVNDGSLVGVALIGSRSAPEFSDQDRRLFQAMVARATAGISQHLLQELAETRAAELAAVVESIPDAVFVGDAKGFRHVNRAGLVLLGVGSVEEANRRVEASPQDLRVRRSRSGDAMAPGQWPFSRALRGETVTNEEMVLRHGETGRDVVIRTAAAPVRIGDRIAGAVVVATDVTGQRQAEEERRRLLRQSEQAVADRDHILAVVSHELRNPLNVVKVGAAVLREAAAPLAEGARKSIASIARAADRMERMIKDLLDVSTIQSGRLAIDPRPVDPRTVVEEIVAAVRPEASERGLAIAADVDPGVPMVRADYDRLLQALANLVGNALKVTAAGRVTVRARPSEEPAVVFAVEDSGPGIAPGLRDRLFEPYWRGKSTYEGTGLGLAITRGIVEAHGGRIWIESDGRSGSTFLFTIPRT